LRFLPGRKILREILPRRIIALNEPDLLFPAPPLDFLLARNRVANVGELFAMNQAKDFVS